MGIRGELFSTRITCEGRTYFFNVKENRMGDVFLTIVESKPVEGENFDRRSIVVFRDDVKGFLKALQGALDFMEKPGPERSAPHFDPAPEAPGARRKRSPAGFVGAGGEGPDEGPAAKPAAGAAAPKKRRVVVKKKGGPSGPGPEDAGGA